jgi:ABC-2 type transport system permease protein
MEILKIATDWAKAEVFSTQFFILFGFLFALASVGFWQLGKTDIAKAYIIPTLIAGLILMIIGFGLYFTNKSRVKEFEIAYKNNSSIFVESELARVESTLKEYQTIVFKIIPLIIAIAAILILFIDSPTWRAISITTIALMVIILLIDGTAHARIEAYNQQLLKIERPEK